MIKHFALMKSLLSNLHDFLKKVSENLSLPDKKGLIGRIRFGKPVVCQMAGRLPDRHTGFLSRLVQLAVIVTIYIGCILETRLDLTA